MDTVGIIWGVFCIALLGFWVGGIAGAYLAGRHADYEEAQRTRYLTRRKDA